MNKKKFFFMVLCAVCSTWKAQSSRVHFTDSLESSKKLTPKNLDIYLLIGQSNMAGRATIESRDLDTLNNVFLYNGIREHVWEKAANPLNKYSSIRKSLSMQKLNPGYTFARKMAQSSDKQIGLVVNAKGGTSIDLWAPGSEFYNEAIKRTKSAMKYGTLKGIMWHQGEADASKYQSYMPKLLDLIRALRKDLGNPNLPFIAGQLSSDKPHREGFNTMILELPSKMKNTQVIKTNHTSTIDSTHFDAASQRLLGERYAKEMLKLQSK